MADIVFEGKLMLIYVTNGMLDLRLIYKRFIHARKTV